jgi:uncharacterized repeat protein (TIGR01451 family)
MKTLYTFIFLVVMMSIVYSSQAQFTGGCSDALGSALVRPCTPTECAPNTGTFMAASVAPSYGGLIFPCATSTISYANAVRFTGAASNLTGEYRITLTLDPADYIENLSLPVVPAYFTGASTTVTIDIPSSSPVAATTFAGYTKTVSSSRVITITWLSKKTGLLPTTQFSFPVSFNLSAGAPANIGVGESMFAGVTGRTSLPPNQVCQTRTIAVAAPLRCSMDPNEKIAYPAGCGDEHFISAQDTITYFLHFQNTGTGPAAVVTLADTLDPKLDINTLQVFDGSHPYRYQMFPGNILVFFFDPIVLPPSAEDAAGSNGFVSFRIAPKATVAPGDVISNKTDIYFDNNPPITTNTVFHTIERPVAPHVSIVNKDQTYCSGNTYTLTASGADSYLWSTGDTTANITITAPGVYSVIGKYVYSCLTAGDTAIVTFGNSAPFSIANKNRNFCPGQSYQFTASAALSYAWSTGATTPSITVNRPGRFIVAGQLACGGTAYDTATLKYDPLISCTPIVYGESALYTVGTKKDGTSLPSSSRHQGNALGANDNLNVIPASNWLSQATVSLGYDRPTTTFIREGVLIIGFDEAATGSISVWSILNNSSVATADVYIKSSFFDSWTYLGIASNQNQYSGLYSASYFELPAGETAAYVRIETLSTSQFSEGFVVEAVSGQPTSASARCAAGTPATSTQSAYPVYPNPFTNVVNIEIPKGEKADIRVVDSFGQRVYERKGVWGTHQVNFNTSLNKGLYYLQIISGNKIETKTISKQ